MLVGLAPGFSGAGREGTGDDNQGVCDQQVGCPAGSVVGHAAELRFVDERGQGVQWYPMYDREIHGITGSAGIIVGEDVT